MSDQTTHPSPEELSAFNLGQLPPETAAAVEDHVSDCETCCETLLGLGSHDTFVNLLKDARRSSDDESANPTFVTGEIPQRKTRGSTIPETLTEHTRYEIVRLIGKGGMGDVFEARHRMMDRTVALKVINHEFIRKPQAVDRFHREVKAAARLSHPNIVTAYDAEQAGEQHFLVMEYVDGVDLANVVKDRGSLTVAEACDFARQAAVGLQHAHDQGMVHRDIKPHNLMVTADGTVKILDFGLASLAPEVLPEEEARDLPGELTAAGAIIGTPDFISPEQARDAHQADIRSDIYSLGATLYYLLSGRAPFADASVVEKLKRHAEQEPVPLENLQIEIPDELANVIRRMMAKDPAERYQTPQEVADALARVSAQLRATSDPPTRLPLTAEKDSEHAKSVRSVAELLIAAAVCNMIWIAIVGFNVVFNLGGFTDSPFWETLGALLFFSSLIELPLALALGFGAWQMRRHQSYSWAVTAAVLATIPVTPVNLVLGIVSGIGALVLLRKPEVKVLFASSAIPGASAGLETSAGSASSHSGRIFRRTASLAFFSFLCVLAGVFYIQLGKTTLKFEIADPSIEVRFGDNSVVFRDRNGADATFTVKPGTKQEFVVEQNGAVVETASLVLNRGDRIVLRVDVVGGKINIVANKDVTVDRQPHDTVESVPYAHDARDSDSSTTVDEVGRFDEHHGYVYRAIVTPDGKYGISGGSDKTIRIWDLETQRQTQILKGHEDAVYGLAVSADGRILASGDKVNTIRLWDLDSTELLAELHGHEGPVTDLSFLPDGRLLSAGFDETLRIWDAHEQKLLRTIDLGAKVEKMEPLWDNRHVMLSGAHTGGWGVVTYDLEKGETLESQASAESCLAVAGDRKTTLVGTITGLLRVHDKENGKLIVQMADPRAKAARDAALTPDGRFAVTTTRDGQMHLWDLQEGKRISTEESDLIGSVTISPDGKYALTVGHEGGMGVWELPEVVRSKSTAPAPVATKETREKLEAMIEAARAAETDNEMQAVVSGYTPMLALLSQKAGGELIELLAELPDEMHQTLLQDGYLKWKADELDAERRQVMLDLFAAVLAQNPNAADKLEQIDAYAAVSDVGFAAVGLPERKQQVLVWYFLRRDVKFPTVLMLTGSTPTALQEALKPDHHQQVRKQVAELIDKPHTQLPPAPVASREIRESLQALLSNLPEGDVTEEAWNDYLSTHASFLAGTRAPGTIARDLVTLLAGLPEDSARSLLQNGFVKWPFSKLDNARQEKIRSIMKGVLSSVPEERRDEKVTDLILNSLATADVGFAVLTLPDSGQQFLAFFAQMPAAFSPSILPVLGGLKEDFKVINSPEIRKQIEKIVEQPESELPPAETVSSVIQFNAEHGPLTTFDRTEKLERVSHLTTSNSDRPAVSVVDRRFAPQVVRFAILRGYVPQAHFRRVPQ